VLSEAAHEIEEAHQHHGLTTAVSAEHHRGDDRTRGSGPTPNPRMYDAGEGGGDGG
jgi:hypothetical protein